MNPLRFLIFCMLTALPVFAEEVVGVAPVVSVPARDFEIRLSPRGKITPWENRRVGWVNFYHGGRAAPDGGDIIAADGKGVLPHSIMQAGPGDFLRVAFQFRGKGEDVKILFGMPEKKSGASSPDDSFMPLKNPETGWAPDSGLRLTTWPLPPQTKADSLSDMLEMLRICKRGRPYGSKFVGSIYHGHHAFNSDTDTFVSEYVGWIGCASDGEYLLATSSDDASFLLIDDKLVVDWPGGHGARWDTKYNKKIQLKKGLHKITYYHVNFAGQTITCAAWQPPGFDKPFPITAESFAPAYHFKPGKIEPAASSGQPGKFQGSVRIINSGECWIDNIRLLRYTVKPSSPYQAINAAIDFGDGITAGRVESAEHIYLSEGMRLIRVGAKGIDFSNRTYIAPKPERSVSRELDKPEDYLKIIGGYEFEKLSVEDNETAFRVLAADEKFHDKAAAACRVLIGREQVAPKVSYDAASFLGNFLRQSDKADEAIEIFRQVIAGFEKQRKLKAELIREVGDTLFYYKHDLPGALNEYDKVVGRYADVLEDNIVRVTKIKIGDIFRQQGNGRKARAIYTEAAEMLLYKRNFAQDQMRKGALYKAVDDFLKRGEFEEAKRWAEVLEWEYPLEKMDGYSSIARAQIAVAENNSPEALKQLLWFAVASPGSAYAAEALFRSAELYVKEGKVAEAVRISDKLAKDYSDSQYSVRVKELLRKR